MVLSLLLPQNYYFQDYKPPKFFSPNPTSAVNQYLICSQIVNADDHSLNPWAPVLTSSVYLFTSWVFIFHQSFHIGLPLNQALHSEFAVLVTDPSNHGGTGGTILSDRQGN